jgi:hypothetical protein
MSSWCLLMPLHLLLLLPLPVLLLLLLLLGLNAAVIVSAQPVQSTNVSVASDRTIRVLLV